VRSKGQEQLTALLTCQLQHAYHRDMLPTQTLLLLLLVVLLLLLANNFTRS
jgi:hypothetical protein